MYMHVMYIVLVDRSAVTYFFWFDFLHDTDSLNDQFDPHWGSLQGSDLHHITLV